MNKRQKIRQGKMVGILSILHSAFIIHHSKGVEYENNKTGTE